MKTLRTYSTYLVFIAALAVGFLGQPRAAHADYTNALKGVAQVKALFDVSAGDAFRLNLVFKAVQDVYQDETVNGLATAPEAAVVFHGPAVKLLSTDSKHYKTQNQEEVKKFQDMLRQMSADGVKVEVCQYALEVLKVDPKTIIPEVHQVGNGFVSIAGYQAQGYSVIVIP